MYKVLIADDERLIRITLKNMIDWQALHCEVIATVKDGKEAYRIFQEVHPEIVITDLKMPEMDGIELITKIKKESRNTQVIVLSNYSDFELVRDAMKAGAFDYLLKITLEKEELTRIITQVKENCEEGGSSQNEEEKQGIKELQQCMVLSKNEHIIDVKEYQRALAQPIFQEYEDFYQLAYFRVDNINMLYEGKFKEHARLQSNLRDLIRESISLYVKHQVIFISNHSGVILFHSAEKLRIITICNSIMRNIEQYLDVHLSITLSDIQRTLKTYDEVYMQVVQAHEQRFYKGEGVLIHSEEGDLFHSLQMNDLQYHVELLEAVQKKNFHQANELIDKTLLYMRENHIVPRQVLEYTIFIINNLEGQEIEKGARQNMPFGAITANIRKCETLDKLSEVLKEGFVKIEEWMKDSSSSKYRREITEVMDFVEKNYHQKLNLKMLAETLDMNESTLSRLFKSETGINLNYYINEKRMKKAKELLQEPAYKIKDVANAVGMEDQLYFNKVFKKYYHVSPSDYRKKVLQDDEA